MKNIVITSCIRVDELADKYPIYQELAVCWERAVRRVFVGWDVCIIGGNASTYKEALWQYNASLEKMWHSEPCNILHIDTDVVTLKYPQFVNHCRDFCCGAHTVGVRYYPHTMSPRVWSTLHETSDVYKNSAAPFQEQDWLFNAHKSTKYRELVPRMCEWNVHMDANNIDCRSFDFIHLHGTASNKQQERLDIFKHLFSKWAT